MIRKTSIHVLFLGILILAVAGANGDQKGSLSFVDVHVGIRIPPSDEYLFEDMSKILDTKDTLQIFVKGYYSVYSIYSDTISLVGKYAKYPDTLYHPLDSFSFAHGWHDMSKVINVELEGSVSFIPRCSDGGFYRILFIAESTYGDGDKDTLKFDLQVVPDVIPEPTHTKGLSNTVCWIHSEKASDQHLCCYDPENPTAPLRKLSLFRPLITDTICTTFENLEDGHRYGYYVKAFYDDSDPVMTDTTYSTQDNSPPEDVTTISAEASSGGLISVCWRSVYDVVSSVEWYYIYRKKEGSQYRRVPIDSVRAREPATIWYCYRDSLDSDSGLEEGEAYYFKVCAVDVVGNIGDGMEANPVIPDSTALRELRFKWVEGKSWDSWNPRTNKYYKRGVRVIVCLKDPRTDSECQGVSSVDSIRFQAVRDSSKFFDSQWQPREQFFDSSWISINSFPPDSVRWEFDFTNGGRNDTSFVNSHEYLFRVRVKDSLGNVNDWSYRDTAGNTVSVTMDAFPPDDIRNLNVVAVVNPGDTTGQMEIHWEAAVDAVSGLQKYYLYRKKDEKEYVKIDSTPNTYYWDPFSKINTSTKICYKIGSVDNVGNERGVSATQWEDCERCLLGPSIFVIADKVANDTNYVCKTEVPVKVIYDITGVLWYYVRLNGTILETIYEPQDTIYVPLPEDGFNTIEVQAEFGNSLRSTWSKPSSVIRKASPPLLVDSLWVINDRLWYGNIYLRWRQPSTDAVEYKIYRDGDSIATVWDSSPYVAWVDSANGRNDMDRRDTLITFRYYTYQVKSLNICGKGNDLLANPDSAYCNRVPRINSEKIEPGQITIYWTRPTPSLADTMSFDAYVRIYEDSCFLYSDTVFNRTQYLFDGPKPGHTYGFEVKEVPLDLATSADDTLQTAWSERYEVPYEIGPAQVHLDIPQRLPVPPPIPSSDTSGCVFLSWSLDTSRSDTTKVELFHILRWVCQDTNNVDTIATVPGYVRNFLDTIPKWNLVYCYTVQAIDKFGQFTADTQRAEICPLRVFTPNIKPFKPKFFNADTIVVKWGWMNTAGTWVDTTYGAESCSVQISIDPEFRHHVTKSSWVRAKPESLALQRPDYVNNNNHTIYCQIKAKDKWGHISPLSSEYFGLDSAIVIYDAVPPPPVMDLKISVKADTIISGLVDVFLTWGPKIDQLSGTKNYEVRRYNNVKDTLIGIPGKTNFTDNNLIADSTLLSYSWYVQPVDSVGNKQMLCDSVCLRFIVPSPDSLKSESKTKFCWNPVDSLIGCITSRYTISYWAEMTNNPYYFNYPNSDVVSDSCWITDTCYTDTTWQLGDTTYFRVKAKVLDFESAWAEIIHYPKNGDPPRNSPFAELHKAIPKVFALNQNYPNPFNAMTTISYELPKEGKTSIEIFNLLGQRVQILVNENKPPGFYTVSWNGANDRGQELATGSYFYKIKVICGSNKIFLKVRKMLYLK